MEHNVGGVSRLAHGGLGPTGAARILSNDDAIAGFAVVTSKGAIALREARIQSDILLTGMAPADLHLSLYLEYGAVRLP